MPYGIYDKMICPVGNHPLFEPQKHQTAVTDYFLNELKYKGLLLYHRLGSGKSCSSIMVSDSMIKVAKTKKIYVITPGSLRQNFIDEYCERCGRSPKYLKKHYTFITSNYTVGNRLPDLNDSLVIIDEVHNLINGVKNQSKHSVLIYNALMNSNCKILALTGTPVFNYIWEFPLLGNLLKPDTFPDIIKDGEIDSVSFMKQFDIDEDGNVKPKNPRMFATRLHGIISYFPGRKGDMPTVIHEPPVVIPMTIPQDDKYWDTFSIEHLTRVKGPPPKSRLASDPAQYLIDMEQFIMATKWITTRLVSNFWYPNDIKKNKPSTRDEINHIGPVLKYKYKPTGEIATTKEFFYKKIEAIYRKEFDLSSSPELRAKVKLEVDQNLVNEWSMQNIGWIEKKTINDHKLTDIFSRKIVAFITNVSKNWNSKHVLFTFFKNKAGVNLIHALFKLCNIRTEVYSGDVTESKRKKILDIFNSEKNRYGGVVKVLLLTESGAEGINILETQHIHILESSTREMKIQQAIGRVVRYKSHKVEGRTPMPDEEQVVHIWRYWSAANNKDPKTILKSVVINGLKEQIEETIVDKSTVDELLYNKGRVIVNSIQSFLNLLKQSSITDWDKTVDSHGQLDTYTSLNINQNVYEACLISDKRYIDRGLRSDQIDGLQSDLKGPYLDDIIGDVLSSPKPPKPPINPDEFEEESDEFEEESDEFEEPPVGRSQDDDLPCDWGLTVNSK